MEEVARLLGVDTRLTLMVCGPDAAAIVAAAAGPLLVFDVAALERAGVMADATLAAALEQRLLCISGLDGLAPPDRARLLQAIDETERRVVVLGHSRSEALALGDRTVLIVDVPMPSFAERQVAWTELTGVEDTRDVAAKFRLSVDQIAAAAEVSRIAARSRDGGGPDHAELDRGARYASVSSVGELAARLDAAYRWDDLVVPERQRMLLRSISAYLRHRDRVLSDWGYERTVARTQGLKVLFAGESGTGKTMGAQVLAAELGLDLFRVDLATVVSKYIGETEKNLERIFTAADGSNAILFFDEADALFGKRSEVSDAHDRYANIEVAYLLQRMEAYAGAVILATNYKRNIDDAFIRRLDFVVDFPFPEADDRRRIWSLRHPGGGAGRRRRRPRLPRDPVQAVRRRDPQLLAGRRVPGRRRGHGDPDAASRARRRAGVREAGATDAGGRFRPLPRVRPHSRGERRLRRGPEMSPGYSFLGGLKCANSSADESGTITPFCSGSGCLVQRARTRPAARLPTWRWSASARSRGPAGVRAAAFGATPSAGLDDCGSRACMAMVMSSCNGPVTRWSSNPTRTLNSVRVGSG